MRIKPLDRRLFLQGLGTAISLPSLDIMLPQVATGQSELPKRALFLYVPMGLYVTADDWVPSNPGALPAQLPSALTGLAAMKDEITIVSNLYNANGNQAEDGPGQHMRVAGGYMTCAHVNRDIGSPDIHTGHGRTEVGISVDQILAQTFRDKTRLPSLELAMEPYSNGPVEEGYSQVNKLLNWSSKSTPMQPDTDPESAFERLFGGGGDGAISERRARQQVNRKSILDFVLESTEALKAKLGADDRQRVDEHLTTIREVERRITGIPSESSQCEVTRAIPNSSKGYGQRLDLMFDLITLAMKCDTSRVFTLALGHEVSEYVFREELGFKDGWHKISHFSVDPTLLLPQYQNLNRWLIARFFRFLEKLKDTDEASGNLLEQSIITFGSGFGSGSRHSQDNLPLIVAGGGGGSLVSGRHLQPEINTPLANLWLTVLNRMGVAQDSFGDSTGSLDL